VPKPIVHSGLPPGAYADPVFLEMERANLFRTSWQWIGLSDGLKQPNGLEAEIAGVPISVTGEPGDMKVYLRMGRSREEIPGAEADLCGRFVFARLTPGGPSLADHLGPYTEVLGHCTENFDEAFHVHQEEWACNWKAGLEITLEGYHVPYVHNESEFSEAVPKAVPPVLDGPNSYQCGVMSEETLGEMANIAKRLKLAQSTIYTNYDHFTVFPNMTIGISGGNLCFMQIYSPISAGRTRLSYAYILACLADPAQKPIPVIKTALLNNWRDFTKMVLGEDRVACENFQRGVAHAIKPALIGDRQERRIAHFHKQWRQAVLAQNTATGTRAA
jgi:phenylpropionate dioxygenase-like ring-hydroxylating dioxygenase large terminal subunit